MKPATVNEHGDLSCPHCPAEIITPDDFVVGQKMEVISGVAVCDLCKKEFRVTSAVAFLANERAKTKAERQKEGAK